MRKSFASIALSLTLLNVGGAWGAEGLFSDVSLNSTVAPPSASQNSQSPMEYQEPQQLPPSTGPADELSLALLIAGYQPKDLSKDVVAITMQVNDATIPVLVSTDKATQQLRITLLLSSLATVRELPTANLLKLMSSNRTLTPAFFTYNEQSQQIELQTLLPAKAASDTRLREELDNLAEIAKKSEKMWNIGQIITSPVAPTESAPLADTPKASPAPNAGTTPAVTIAPAAPPVANQQPVRAQAPAQAKAPASSKSPSLVGTWSAALSNQDAFALMLKSNGSFVLVHVKNGKKTQTSGNSTLAGNLLTLTSSDGTKLAGSVTLKSAKEFDFRPQSTSASVRNLTFKKAK